MESRGPGLIDSTLTDFLDHLQCSQYLQGHSFSNLSLPWRYNGQQKMKQLSLHQNHRTSMVNRGWSHHKNFQFNSWSQSVELHFCDTSWGRDHTFESYQVVFPWFLQLPAVSRPLPAQLKPSFFFFFSSSDNHFVQLNFFFLSFPQG